MCWMTFRSCQILRAISYGRNSIQLVRRGNKMCWVTRHTISARLYRFARKAIAMVLPCSADSLYHNVGLTLKHKHNAVFVRVPIGSSFIIGSEIRNQAMSTRCIIMSFHLRHPSRRRPSLHLAESRRRRRCTLSR
jgi:hypothetical protein